MGDRLYHRTWERWLSVRTFARTNIFTDLPFLLLCSPDFREELFLCAHQCCAATANRPCNIARRRHRSCMPYRGRVIAFPRSEAHTSELQSLMRISYAVFCLKKNTLTATTEITDTTQL